MTRQRPGEGMEGLVESLAERQIREGIERGEFDALPGAGKPLEGVDGPHDELWWVKAKMRREGLDGVMDRP